MKKKDEPDKQSLPGKAIAIIVAFLLLILLMVTGLRHPPTANDSEPLGKGRTVLGWLTLSFLLIGFTPTPIAEVNGNEAADPQEQAVPVAADYGAEAI